MTIRIAASITALTLLAALFLYSQSTFASAPPGLPASQAVATTTQVGPQAKVTLFSANGSCTARVVSTRGTDIFLVFADPTNGNLSSTTLAFGAGFYQAASTTVAYDGGLYGCGRMIGYALASTTITISQMQ